MLCGILAGLILKPDASPYFEIAKNLDVFASLYREVNAYYVEDVEPYKLIKKGIDAMLESLDPYTNFIPEEEIEDFRFVTTGEYGGIGAVISEQDNDIIILEPYEDSPALKAGLEAGDKILEVDGKSTKGKTTNDISKILKGQPGTDVTLTIQKFIDKKTIKVPVTREEIKIDNVAYQCMLDSNTAYINLKGFTQKASREVKDAFTTLKDNGAKKLILDLRDNPGGLLHEAVNISNIFLQKGREIVSTRGKVKEWDKVYEGLNTPVDIDIPMVVLINRGSASASEIISGVIQDYDRGIIIGERSFGKGLVQTSRPLSYKAQLKVTTAKYYTPSGRCIQAVDYAHRNEDGSVGKIPDSLRVPFKTKNGRVVYSGGGIEPDITIERKPLSDLASVLILKRMIFNYALKFHKEHSTIKPVKDFVLDENDYKQFRNWLVENKFEYQNIPEREVEQFKTRLEKLSVSNVVKETIETLEKNIKANKNDEYEINKEEIKQLLKEEIARLYYYQKGYTEATLKNDQCILSSKEILNNADRYSALLKGK